MKQDIRLTSGRLFNSLQDENTRNDERKDALTTLYRTGYGKYDIRGINGLGRATKILLIKRARNGPIYRNGM
ncbi:hypothetical protein MKX08_005150 [Trichoderma sp. CBMAI-0020]|nr:hypothetical protein MKX08_005150 [Trichoderma sp. CBMAI-0020]